MAHTPPDTPDLKDLLDLASHAARQAGALALGHYGGPLQANTKGGDDPVTAADLEADRHLRQVLLAACPGCGWLSEETADDPQRLQHARVWIVDPVDGTREFVEGVAEWVVSVALVDAGEPVVGVIHNPVTGDLYAAVRGGGAFANGRRVFCTEPAGLRQAVLIVSRSETRRGEIQPFLPHLGQVRPVGSVAYKLALVASGTADLNASVQAKNEWDVCAGDLLIREAGGTMVDLDGQVRRYNQPDPLLRGGLVAG
ncbi:MAG: 3'(2'),5'-bisphosphate nucleotidase CysQ, partial [Candidatus Latescibacterota bacterium]